MRMILLIFLILSIGSTACYTPRYVHSPAAHNVPLLEKTRDSKIGLYYSSVIGNRNSQGSRVEVNRSSGLDFQFAYALNSKIFVQGSWYHRKEINDGDYSYINLDSSVIRYKRNLYELGMGYYFKRNQESKFAFQLSGGLAFGRYEFTDRGKDASNAEFNRFFKTAVMKGYIQPAMIYKMKSWLTNIISSRISVLDFHNQHTNYTQTELNNFKLDSISFRPVIFWEPAIVQSLTFKKLPGIKFELQAGLSLLTSRNFVDTRPFNLSAGIIIDPGKVFKGKEEKPKTNDTQIPSNQ